MYPHYAIIDDQRRLLILIGTTHVSHERIERSQHRPTRAQCLGSVLGCATWPPSTLGERDTATLILTVAADIRTDHGYLIHTRHSEDARNRGPIVRPFTKVVAEPLADTRSRTGEGRPGNYESSLAWSAREHSIVRRGGHHGPIEVI